jgi:hypothetical protein
MTSSDMMTSANVLTHMSQFGEFELTENNFQKKREVVPFLLTLKEETAPGFEAKFPFSQNWQEQRSFYGKHLSKTAVLAQQCPQR